MAISGLLGGFSKDIRAGSSALGSVGQVLNTATGVVGSFARLKAALNPSSSTSPQKLQEQREQANTLRTVIANINSDVSKTDAQTRRSVAPFTQLGNSDKGSKPLGAVLEAQRVAYIGDLGSLGQNVQGKINLINLGEGSQADKLKQAREVVRDYYNQKEVADARWARVLKEAGNQLIGYYGDNVSSNTTGSPSNNPTLSAPPNPQSQTFQPTSGSTSRQGETFVFRDLGAPSSGSAGPAYSPVAFNPNESAKGAITNSAAQFGPVDSSNVELIAVLPPPAPLAANPNPADTITASAPAKQSAAPATMPPTSYAPVSFNSLMPYMVPPTAKLISSQTSSQPTNPPVKPAVTAANNIVSFKRPQSKTTQQLTMASTSS